jgi:hypothetical protein
VSAPFVSQLRSNRKPITIGESADALNLRVEASDVWETVRVVASPDTGIADLKNRVVAELFPNEPAADFVLKFRGWELLDMGASLAESGLQNGSIILLGYRRRRPVR